MRGDTRSDPGNPTLFQSEQSPLQVLLVVELEDPDLLQVLGQHLLTSAGHCLTLCLTLSHSLSHSGSLEENNTFTLKLHQTNQS